jgi:cell fate regulator YaaT (PSP1 superfamily)
MAVVATVRIPGAGDARCEVAAGVELSPGDACVVEMDRVHEFGRVVLLSDGGSQDDPDRRPVGRVLRSASADDGANAESNRLLAARALDRCTQLAAAEDLALHPLAAHVSLGRERIVIRYRSARAVDTRGLGAGLQKELGVRAELRPVGLRDEAAILGGLGPCGRTVCCTSWMPCFRTVSLHMARAQDLSLNPDAVGGGCGRLKCCLRFELETYRRAAEALPREGAVVGWEDREGVVVARGVLRGRLTVRMADGRLETVDAARVRVRRPAPRDAATEREEADDADPGSEWTEPQAARHA